MEPGIYKGIPIGDYHNDPHAISKSGLDEIASSPRRWWGSHLDPRRPRTERKETAAQLVGNMAHCAVLEFDQFNQRYRVGPEVSNKNVKKWQDFKAECEADNACAIDSQQYEIAMRMRESVLDIPEAAELLTSGSPEDSVYWIDPETGVLCRCRPDWTHKRAAGRILMDVKTYDEASADELARQVPRMSYEKQDAFYTDGVTIATGEPVLAFLFLAIETTYPYVANLLMLDDESKASGRRKYRRDLNVYAECLKNNVWPGHGSGIKLISLPQWAMDNA